MDLKQLQGAFVFGPSVKQNVNLQLIIYLFLSENVFLRRF